METFWYAALAGMLIAYVVLDGFDLGAGIVHLVLARSERERRVTVASIGPFWDGNEVWLVAAGGVLFFAFPLLYGAAFSGFYLALMLFLWLLIARGVGLEVRNALASPLWRSFWDAAFGLSSLLLAFLLGVALGNLLRGVGLGGSIEGGRALDPNHFFAPLWTDFRIGESPGLIDWFTALFGIIGALALALHGALWIALKTDDPFRERLRPFAVRLWAVLAVLVGLSFVAVHAVRGPLLAGLATRPLPLLLVLLGLTALVSVPVWTLRGAERLAFAASSTFIAAMLAATAAASYPTLLRSTNPAHPDLTIADAAVPGASHEVALWWWPVALALVVGYFFWVHYVFRGKGGHSYPSPGEK